MVSVESPITRRSFLGQSAAASVGAALAMRAACSSANDSAKQPPLGKAEHCIFIWLAGGACQIDTFDPKRKSTGRKDPGSYYESIPTAINDAKVCEHLRAAAPLLDRGVLVRSVHHDVVDEHAAATNRLHTGRPTSGTIIYPSIGSIVAQQKGPGGEGVPRYVVMGYPSASRGPGFLGAEHGYIYLTQTAAGPSGLQRPDDVSEARQTRRLALLEQLRGDFAQRTPRDEQIAAYVKASEEGFRLAGPKFMNVFDLQRESADLRQSYGGEFGQRLLLARRLVGSGVRFVEVTSNLNFKNGTGWDTHNQGQLKQHELIAELDQGLAALLVDLEKQKQLDRTLVVVATEFGRPPQFDGGGGRGHQSGAFTCCLFGGGLRTGQVIGATDELGAKIVADPVSVPDLHATIHTALGIRPHEELYAGDRPVPITDGGRAIARLF